MGLLFFVVIRFLKILIKIEFHIPSEILIVYVEFQVMIIRI